MRLTNAPALAAPRPFSGRSTPVWLVLALAGWASVIALGLQLWAATPRRAGFDLELILAAGRRVAGGASPYDASLLAGTPPAAVDLFYSYPPPVAQYASLFASVPLGAMLAALGLVAVVGLVVTALALGRWVGVGPSARSAVSLLRSAALPAVAIAPLVFPFAIAILFGNLDVLFPLLYGLMLLGALAYGLPARFGGGAALVIAAIAKLHPGSMGLWFLVRGFRERRDASRAAQAAGASDGRRAAVPGSWVVLGAAIAVAVVILGVSLVAGGLNPWVDYVSVLRVGSAAQLVDLRNIGPAAQLGLLFGNDEDVARLAQIAVTAAALAGTAAVAWWGDDTLESFAWATALSLIVLPVTWFHYPVAFIPVALVAWLRAEPASRSFVGVALIGAIVVAMVAAAIPVLMWLAVGLVLLAVRRSVPLAVAPLTRLTLEPSRVSRFPIPGRDA